MLIPEIVFNKERCIATTNRINEIREMYKAKMIAGHNIDQINDIQQITYWD